MTIVMPAASLSSCHDAASPSIAFKAIGADHTRAQFLIDATQDSINGVLRPLGGPILASLMNFAAVQIKFFGAALEPHGA
jgi:hypothetical protein